MSSALLPQPGAVRPLTHPLAHQETHRVRCPCGGWAQVRVAHAAIPGARPSVIMFSCIDQTAPGHRVPGPDELLALIPPRELALGAALRSARQAGPSILASSSHSPRRR